MMLYNMPKTGFKYRPKANKSTKKEKKEIQAPINVMKLIFHDFTETDI